MLPQKFTNAARSVAQHKEILSQARSGADIEAARRFFVKEVNHNNDLTFDNQGNVVPSTAGWRLVDAMNKACPEREILDRFMNVITMPGNPVMDWALDEQFRVIRTGFTERGLFIEDAQTNGQHVNNMLAMSGDNLVRAKIILHDMAESMTTDFSKPFVEQNNLAETKIRLEKMAAAILFQKEPAFFQLWMEYEEKTTWRDRLVKEFDNLEHLVHVSQHMPPEVPRRIQESFVEAVEDTIRNRIKNPYFLALAITASMSGIGGVLQLPAPASQPAPEA